MNPEYFHDVAIDHVEFYVSDAVASAADLVTRYGFEPYASMDGAEADHVSVAVRQGNILFVLTQALDLDHPAALYVQKHGDGVANVALTTTDATEAFHTAVVRGARPVAEPATWPGQPGLVTAAIGGFGDLTHTLIERADPGRWELPGLVVTAGSPAPAPGNGLRDVDHLAVCVEAGELSPTIAYYESVLDFQVIYEERISVGSQAMLSQVIASRSGRVTLTLLEPDRSADAGQIDDFLKDHGGPGVQHVALLTDDIVGSVGALRSQDVAFLTAPAAYYRLLASRIELAKHSIDDLRSQDLLVDSDHDGQLFQIFARSTHPRRTFFFEVIERLGAKTFGTGNIKALYEAVEAERIRSHTF